jgi:hypothetical protein
VSRTPRPSAIRRALVGLLGAIVAVLAAAGGAAAGVPRDLLPDLRMALPDSLTVCGAPTSGTFQTENCPGESADDRWLRFDSILMNVGRGTFRVIGRRSSPSEEHFHMVQRIRRSDGSWRKVPTEAVAAWGEEEDGHPHWHTQAVERYRLFRLPEPFANGAKVGVKRGYCFFDGQQLRPDLPHAKSSPVYSFNSCYGTLGNGVDPEDELFLRVGVSVGWGDEYPWNYAGQRIRIKDAPDGEYVLCLTADPNGDFEERNDQNNESWARIELTTHTNAGGYRVDVDVLARGKTPCQTQIPYEIPDLLGRQAAPTAGHH